MPTTAKVAKVLNEVEQALEDVPSTIKDPDDGRQVTHMIQYLMGVAPGISTLADLEKAARYYMRDHVADLAFFLDCCGDLSEAWLYRE